MDQSKTSKPVVSPSFPARFSAGLSRALDSKTEWTDKVKLLVMKLILAVTQLHYNSL